MSELKKYPKFYVGADYLSYNEKIERDRWCLRNFGEFRHDEELDEGWWLQNDEEYSWFVLRWGDKIYKDC